MAITHGPPRPMELATGPRGFQHSPHHWDFAGFAPWHQNSCWWWYIDIITLITTWQCILIHWYIDIHWYTLMIHWYSYLITICWWNSKVFFFHFLDFVCIFFPLLESWSPGPTSRIIMGTTIMKFIVWLSLIIHRKTIRRNLFGTTFFVPIRYEEKLGLAWFLAADRPLFWMSSTPDETKPWFFWKLGGVLLQ